MITIQASVVRRMTALSGLVVTMRAANQIDMSYDMIYQSKKYVKNNYFDKAGYTPAKS